MHGMNDLIDTMTEAEMRAALYLLASYAPEQTTEQVTRVLAHARDAK